MNFERIKLLPLMIVVAMFAFSIRFAEVVTGFSTLGGAAMAEEKADTPPAEQQIAMAETPDEGGENDEGMELTEEPPSEEGDVEWRDASDEELQYSNVREEMFQDLVKRRKSLDQREKQLVTREALLRAAEQELDRKYQELSGLRTEIERLLEQQSEEEQKRIDSLVKIYEGMKPKDAARIFDTLDLDVLVAVMSKMSERRLSPVLAAMNAERARTITIMLAEQKKLPELPQAN